MLRERIWKLLVNFSTNFKMTVIITTHYIEEAKRSTLVGFMKKGFLMSEQTPENLFQNYATRSLETIFYRLCLSDKKRKNSEIKGPITGKLNTIGDKRTSLIQEIDKSKNFYFYNKQL